MKHDCYLVRYSEIGLKGNVTRRNMESLLVKSIKTLLEKDEKIRKSYSRIIIDSGRKGLIKDLRRVPGVASYSPCLRLGLDDTYSGVKKIVQYYKPENFRISTQRINKKLEKNSVAYDRELGARIVQDYGLKVKLRNSAINVGVELLDESFVFSDRVNGLGGLPQNPKNQFSALLDSDVGVVAALLMIRRGLFPKFYYTKKNYVRKLERFVFYDFESVKIRDWREVEGDIMCVGWGLESLDRIKKLKEKGLVATPVVNSPGTFINYYASFLK